VIAFDVGPANAWLDAVVQLASEGVERFDRDGRRAARGRVAPALLDELLQDEFLRRPPPKSTGRERYGLAEAEAWFSRSRQAGLSADDLPRRFGLRRRGSRKEPADFSRRLSSA
jgi:anhydro-N-acetylmuramic acid kinase